MLFTTPQRFQSVRGLLEGKHGGGCHPFTLPAADQTVPTRLILAVSAAPLLSDVTAGKNNRRDGALRIKKHKCCLQIRLHNPHLSQPGSVLNATSPPPPHSRAVSSTSHTELKGRSRLPQHAFRPSCRGRTGSRAQRRAGRSRTPAIYKTKCSTEVLLNSPRSSSGFCPHQVSYRGERRCPLTPSARLEWKVNRKRSRSSICLIPRWTRRVPRSVSHGRLRPLL